MEYKDIGLEMGKLVGEPINYRLPRPVELDEIANFETAEAGEHVWRFTNLDADVDTILDVDTTDGKVQVKKRSPLGDTELSFKQFNSQLEYVLMSDILENPDVNVLSRKKDAITRGINKLELKLILDAILSDPGVASGGVPSNGSIATQSIPSGGDLYDVIIKAKQQIEDYGDNYILLAGSNVSKAIDLYDKDKAGTFYYNVTLKDRLAKEGIKVVKVFGQVKSGAATEGGASTSKLLDADKFILVAKNSRIASGKPITFVRRKLHADMANAMGIQVDNAQRGYLAHPTPIVKDFSGNAYNVWAYGVAAYESVIFAITNPYAIVKSASLSSLT